MKLFPAIATVGGMTLISRALGFVRDVLVAAFLGAGVGADAFFVAFKIPNLFRRLFAEGAFASAFVPLFASHLEGEDRVEGRVRARHFAEEALAVLFWILLVFVVVIEITMPWVMAVFAPGFIDEPEKFKLAVDLARITFPYLLFISLVSLLGGVLNSVGRFWAAAATPVLLNISLITGISIGAAFGLPAPALAWGVAVAGVIQFIWLFVHAARAGFWLKLRVPRLTRGVKTLLKRILPVAIGAGIYQVNLLIDTVIASLLPTGAIAYLFYADRITQLPLGVIGVAVGTALLPLLARNVAAGHETDASNNQNRAVEFSLLLTLPAAVALFIGAGAIVSGLFERGEFGAEAASLTAAALAVYALGLPAYVLVKAFAPGFFARGDTTTPIKVGFAAMIINVVLNLALMGPFGHVGIAAATVVSSWVNAGALGVILYRRGHFRPDAQLLSRLPRGLLASLMMGACVFGALNGLDGPLSAGPDGEAMRALALGVVVATGLGTFALFSFLLGTVKAADLRRLLRRSPS